MSDSLVQAGHALHGPCFHIIRQLALAVKEADGILDERTGAIALQAFSLRGFVSEPDWEEERLPLDAPGVVIALANNTKSIEALPAKQIAHLVQSGDAQTFFRRYENGGDGLPVLQQRFVEKRQAIVSLFGGLAATAAAYQTSTETK